MEGRPSDSQLHLERWAVRSVLEGAGSMADEMLIGFDAREAVEYLPRWDGERRQRFLLRHDVARPLSVDARVWPTIVDGT